MQALGPARFSWLNATRTASTVEAKKNVMYVLGHCNCRQSKGCRFSKRWMEQGYVDIKTADRLQKRAYPQICRAWQPSNAVWKTVCRAVWMPEHSSVTKAALEQASTKLECAFFSSARVQRPCTKSCLLDWGTPCSNCMPFYSWNFHRQNSDHKAIYCQQSLIAHSCDLCLYLTSKVLLKSWQAASMLNKMTDWMMLTVRSALSLIRWALVKAEWLPPLRKLTLMIPIIAFDAYHLYKAALRSSKALAHCTQMASSYKYLESGQQCLLGMVLIASASSTSRSIMQDGQCQELTKTSPCTQLAPSLQQLLLHKADLQQNAANLAVSLCSSLMHCSYWEQTHDTAEFHNPHWATKEVYEGCLKTQHRVNQDWLPVCS